MQKLQCIYPAQLLHRVYIWVHSIPWPQNIWQLDKFRDDVASFLAPTLDIAFWSDFLDPLNSSFGMSGGLIIAQIAPK